MTSRNLLEKRTQIVTEMRGLTDEPSGDGGDLSEAQEKRFDTLKGELAGVERNLARQQAVEDAERRMAGAPSGGDAHLDAEMRNFSLAKMLQKQLGVTIDVGREVEMSQELARREGRSSEGFFVPYAIFEKRTAMTSATSGSLIAQEHMAGQYIDLLRMANPLSGFGMRTISGLQGNVEIPRLTESTSVGWTAENSMLPDTGAKFDKLALTPKHVGAVSEYSRNMLLQSSPDIEQILRGDLAQVLGLEMARAALYGAGGVEPVGILNTPGVQKIAAPAKLMDYVPEAAAALFSENVTSPAYLGSAGLKSRVDLALTADGLPVGASAFFRNAPGTFSSLVSEDFPLIAGDFSQVIQGTWGAIEILLNPFAEAAYRRGNVMIRIVCTTDIGLRHPRAFCLLEA